MSSVMDHSIGNCQPHAKRYAASGLSLRTLMILFTAIIVWMGLRADRLIKEKSIAEKKSLLGELSVTDLDLFGIRSAELNPSDLLNVEWEVYLPRESGFQICWARSSIAALGLPASYSKCNVPSGFRKLKIEADKEHDNWNVILLVDGKAAMSEKYDGNMAKGVLLRGRKYNRVDTQQLTIQPLELMRNIFNPNAMSAPLGTTLGTGEGILIWIEKN